MAHREAPDLLFAGRLLHVNFETDDLQIQIEKDAITFLQKLAEPITVVSIHGAQARGKTRFVHDLVARENANVEPLARAEPMVLPTVEQASGVWLYVKRSNYSDARYIAFIDRNGFSSNVKVERLLYAILAGLSSVVIHHTNGALTSDTLDAFTFLAADDVSGDEGKSSFVLPHGPKLLWLQQNVTTGDLKEILGAKNLSSQEVEQGYLRSVFAGLPPHYHPFISQFGTAFTDQICSTMPAADSSAYDKKLEKILRVLMESGRNRYLKGVQLNGPLFGSILVSMLAHRDDSVFQVFRGRVWKEVIHNCCLNIVESAIKLYKSRMAEQLNGIVDTSDLHDYTPLFVARESLPAIELPCESDVLQRVHAEAKRTAKLNLRTMPVRSGKLNSLLKKLFKDLVDSLYTKIREENNRLSSSLCRALLEELHAEMTTKVERHLEVQPHEEDGSYAVQSLEFKRFFHNYQSYLFDLMGEYTDRARGPVKREELSHFCQETIRLQMKDLAAELENIRERDVAALEEAVEENEKKVEEENAQQKIFQREAMNAQTEVNKELVEVARLQAQRKEALEGAIDDLDNMHALATKQKQLLEEAAFVSVQLPSQKVIEAAKESIVTQLQGYLIKQGGGGNAFNPLGRRNWKQRCRVEPSTDAGEGFEIIPPQSGKNSHVFELQRGLFDKNSRKKSSYADNGRVFKLRALSIEERANWIKMLRQSAGGYK